MKSAERKRELKVQEEKKALREELKQKLATFEGTAEAKEELIKNGEKELDEKIVKIDQNSQKEKEKYLKDLNACASKFFDHQSFLGSDRAFRNYYMYESLPGLFVEQDITFAGKCLDAFVKNNPGLANCTNDQRYAFIKQMVLNDNKNDDKENKIANDKEDKDVGKVTIKDLDYVTQQDLLLCSSDPKNCIIHTPDHPDRVVWTYYNTEEEINALIKSLNVRGYREKALLDNLSSEKQLIINFIKDCPVEKLTIKPEEKDEKMNEIVKKYLKKYDYANMNLEPGTDPTIIFDALMRENILEFEMKINMGCLGGIKVSDRLQWRKYIETFDYQALTDELIWGTQAKKLNGIANGHKEDEDGDEENVDEEQEPEEESDVEGEELEPGLALGNTTVLESEDSSEEDGFSLHDSDILRDKVKSLASALLQIEQGIETKFIRQPFGPKKELKDKNAMNKALFYCKKRILKWENSLMNSTNLSQIFLHYNILHDAISWSKSAQKMGCMVCRRKNEPEQTLLCDDCNKAWHMFCLRPKLKVIPEGEWYCPKCRPEDYKVERKSRKRRIFVEEEIEEDPDETLDDSTLDETTADR
jgi:bromodomain adjacent to zinc finger domain protein 1A